MHARRVVLRARALPAHLPTRIGSAQAKKYGNVSLVVPEVDKFTGIPAVASWKLNPKASRPRGRRPLFVACHVGGARCQTIVVHTGGCDLPCGRHALHPKGVPVAAGLTT